MDGNRLRELRKAHGLKQAHVGELLGLTAAYIGELERGEKRIDPRLAERIRKQVSAHLYVGFSRALNGWTVSVVSPTPSGASPGRIHEVMNKYNTKEEAAAAADALKMEQYPFATVTFHDNRPPVTTNPGGL